MSKSPPLDVCCRICSMFVYCDGDLSWQIFTSRVRQTFVRQLHCEMQGHCMHMAFMDGLSCSGSQDDAFFAAHIPHSRSCSWRNTPKLVGEKAGIWDLPLTNYITIYSVIANPDRERKVIPSRLDRTCPDSKSFHVFGSSHPKASSG